MLELGIGASVVRGLGWLFWGLFALALCAAIWRPKTKPRKLGWALLVLAIFFGPLVPGIYQNYEYQQRLKVAQALFAERCKTAGEKIYRTVEGVEGVLLLNVRPETVTRDDQFERYDPYGYEGGGAEYIKSFLAGHWKTCVGKAEQCPAGKKAFEYVEVQSADTKYKRFFTVDRDTNKPFQTGSISIPVLMEDRSANPSSRYSVSWSDVSTEEDRRNWIAGGRIIILANGTNEILAERTGYYMDPGLGNKSGSRSPWAWARQYTAGCPSMQEHNFVFVRKILKPF